MEQKISNMIINAKKQITNALINTTYSSFISEIIDDYKEFIIVCINFDLITSEDDLNLFEIKEVKYFDGTAYASWSWHTLSLQKRFFVERNSEERRNVLFHELIHSMMIQLFSFDNPFYMNALNYFKNINNLLSKEKIDNIRKKYSDIFTSKYYEKNSNVVCEAFQTFNEVTTQYLAEILTALSYNTGKKLPCLFESKILEKNEYFVSSFVTYPEYEQIFINFLRTINGFGEIENNDELFMKWYSMLSNGTIWNQIISTYKQYNNIELLFDFLISYAALRIAKESSMGISVVYKGNKQELTDNLIELDKRLIKFRNMDKECIFPYEKYSTTVEKISGKKNIL